MGESSACLVRSLSQPSPTSSEEKKGSTLQRALTTSVSFGRFMSESLDWEKWSSFTHNRHLEEVEKYSKPGSVAEKKAYFEAHFKRRRAAALLEQQNAAASDLPETNMEFNVKDNTSSDLDSAQRDSCAVIENMKDGEVQSSDPIFPVGQNDSYDASIENEKATALPILMEIPVELTKHIVSTKEDKAHNEDEPTKRNSASLSETKSEVSSSKFSTIGGASKCAPPIMPSQIKNSVKTQDNKKIGIESSNKRRSYATSLHMSITLAPSSQKAISPGLPKIANSRFIRAPAQKYKNGMIPQTSTRASVSGIFKHNSAAPPAENRRTATPQGDSNSVRRAVDWKWKVHTPSSDYSKSSNTFEGKARLPTASSPFTFKSEERAAKRKEFFQRLEQKLKSKETENNELHAKSQVKARSNFKDLRSSILSKATENAEVPPRIKLLSNLKKKVPTERPCFPKIDLTAKTEGLKDVAGKNRHLSRKCFSKKTNENASPNIWL